MDQPPATTPATAVEPPPQDSQQLGQDAPATPPGFGSRGRARRRTRFLRKARELAYRDLGGLVFSLHRFGVRNDSLVLAKLSTLARIDAELRALESSLAERQSVTVLREAGIAACPRCAAIHSGEDNFCPNCGLPMSRNVDLLADFSSPATPAGPPPAGTPATDHPSAAQSPPATPAQDAQPGAAGASAGTPPSPAVPGATPAAGVPPLPPSAPSAPPDPRELAARPGGGRSPNPPSAPADGESDQPTEIIRPPAGGA